MVNVEKNILDYLQNYLPKITVNSVTDEIKREFNVIHDASSEGFQFYSRSLNITRKTETASIFVIVEIGFEQVIPDRNAKAEGFYVKLKGYCTNESRTIEDDDYSILGKFRGKTELSDLVELLEEVELTKFVYSEIEKFIECIEEKLNMEKSA